MTFKIVILSARAANLIPCVRAVLEHEPNLPPENIIVVDDGAREDAETHLPDLSWLAGVKPFVFARNANLGLRAAGTDVILLNDDARLLTPHGFTRMAEMVRRHSELGICSAGIRGLVNNRNQLATSASELRLETSTLAFVCVYFPWTTYQQIGPLDERFTGYGFEDNDYCARVLRAGLQLGIWDGCVVDHSGELPSTYRTRRDLQHIFQHNRRLFQEKWQDVNNAVSVAPGVRAELPAGLRLNLGCCESALEGYINRDIFPGPDGEAVDFEQPWPWADDSVAFVRAWDFVEHLPHKAFTMNEVWRVLVPGGQVEITVPTTEGSGAFQDPTHVSFWNRRSFLYYEAGNPYRERFALHYGIRAKFRVVREETVPTIDGSRLTIVLEAVKP